MRREPRLTEVNESGEKLRHLHADQQGGNLQQGVAQVRSDRRDAKVSGHGTEEEIQNMLVRNM